ncbi:hypothetical protein EAH89_12420 [Roseomonas nepalensis]|uniref:Uncharacterized protein n=1 Tax=Muricoccus nepalensis TaxID=1854500 RepID=A0A502G7T4_9PROT|nr:hypothetical protein [Roseomonas nepalensis]TPG56873.1 hypothetical protein EAH89_12420 [Roseomonas nepalensis]
MEVSVKGLFLAGAALVVALPLHALGQGASVPYPGDMAPHQCGVGATPFIIQFRWGEDTAVEIRGAFEVIVDVWRTDGAGLLLRARATRSEIEALGLPLLRRRLDSVRQKLSEAGIPPYKIWEQTEVQAESSRNFDDPLSRIIEVNFIGRGTRCLEALRKQRVDWIFGNCFSANLAEDTRSRCGLQLQALREGG